MVLGGKGLDDSARSTFLRLNAACHEKKSIGRKEGKGKKEKQLKEESNIKLHFTLTLENDLERLWFSLERKSFE